MTYTKIPPKLAEQLETQLSWCDNDHSRQAWRMIRLLDDEDLLEIARTDIDNGQTSPVFERVIAKMGGNLWYGGSTNPAWLTAGAAETAYYRGLMDETEMDRITE